MVELNNVSSEAQEVVQIRGKWKNGLLMVTSTVHNDSPYPNEKPQETFLFDGNVVYRNDGGKWTRFATGPKRIPVYEHGVSTTTIQVRKFPQQSQ